MLYQMLSYTLSHFIDSPSFLKRFSLKLFFISRTMRKAAFEGRIDYIPSYLSEIPGLFSSNRIGLDAAIVQMSPPDKYGYCSLGVSVDITRAGLENARLVIAQINPRMPHPGATASSTSMTSTGWCPMTSRWCSPSLRSRTTKSPAGSGTTCQSSWMTGRPSRSGSATCPSIC